MKDLRVGTLILGGGAAGLWLLDALRREGRSALLAEPHALGNGQTIVAQGILHSGLKYALQGLLTSSAREAREMPAIWRECLAGATEPNLSQTDVCSESFHLWATDSLSSKLGMFGAKLGLHVTPRSVPGPDRPSLLRSNRGAVYRVDEQVLSPASLLRNLAERNRDRIVKIDPRQGARFETAGPGLVRRVQLRSGDGTRAVSVVADWVVFAAGKGNGALREDAGLASEAMQLRPLHAVLVRGDLPEFYGHCIDGAKTRVSITSARDAWGTPVWHLGGQIAEDGVRMESAELIQRAQGELRTVLPGLDLARTEWSTFRVDRAEGATGSGARPETFRLFQEGNVLTAWPTKLVLVPQLTASILSIVATANDPQSADGNILGDWPRPGIATPVWDRALSWTAYRDDALRFAA